MDVKLIQKIVALVGKRAIRQPEGIFVGLFAGTFVSMLIVAPLTLVVNGHGELGYALAINSAWSLPLATVGSLTIGFGVFMWLLDEDQKAQFKNEIVENAQ